MMKGKLLVVEHALEKGGDVSAALRGEGYNVEAAACTRCTDPGPVVRDHDAIIVTGEVDDERTLKTLQALGADPATEDVPVFLLSGNASAETVVRGLEAGAEDVFPVDVRPADLEARIAVSLFRRRERANTQTDRRDIDRLIGAAERIGAGGFHPNELGLQAVLSRPDRLGRFAHVFAHLAQQVYDRERKRDLFLRTIKGSMLVIAAGAVFGLGPAIGRISHGLGLPPLGVVFWANCVAALVCLAVSFARSGLPRLSREDLKFLVAWAVILGCAYQPMTAIVAAHVEASTIALVGSSRGFIVFLLAALLALEAPSFRRFLGLGIGFGAVAIVVSMQSTSMNGADPQWLMASMILPALLALHTLLMSWRRRTVGSCAAVGIMMGMSGLLLLPLAMATDSLFLPWGEHGARVWVVLALGLSTALALVIALDLVSFAGPVFASQMAYSQTLAGIAWGVLLLDESLTPLAWAALAIVTAGFWLVAPRSIGAEFKATLPMLGKDRMG